MLGMLILGLIILIWIATGFLIARYGLNVREILILPPLALGIGTALQFFILNIILHFLPVTVAVWLVLALMLAIGGGCYFLRRQKVSPLQLSIPPYQAIILLVIWLAFALIAAKVVTTYQDPDEEDHGPRSSVLGSAGLALRVSMRSYANPQNCNFYHYAENMIAGVLARQTGITHLSYVAWTHTVYNVTSAVGLCFVLLWLLLKRKAVFWCAIGAGVFVFVGPALWVTDVGRLLSFDYQSASTLPFSYANALMTSGIAYMSTANSLGFWVIGLLAYIAFLHLDGQKWFAYPAIGVLAASATVYYTTGGMIILAPIGLYLLSRLWLQRHAPYMALQNAAFYGMAGLFTLALQGGVITDTLFCPAFGDAYQNEEVAKGESLFDFRIVEPSYAIPEYQIPRTYFLHPSDWDRVIKEWGFGIPLALITLLYLIYSRQTHAALICLGCLGSVTAAFVMESTVTPLNNYRLANVPLWMVSALSVIMFAQLSQHKWTVVRRGVWVIAPLLIFGLTATDLSNSLWYFNQAPVKSKVMHAIDYQVRDAWYAKLDPVNERVWGLSLTYPSQIATARTQMTFGTFGNLPAHHNFSGAENTRFVDWQEDGYLPEGVLSAGYTYLYLDESYAEKVDWLNQFNLANPAYYEQVAQYGVGEESRTLLHVLSDACPETDSLLGLSPEALAAYESQALPFEFSPETVIFDPARGAIAYDPKAVLPVIGRYANGLYCKGLGTETIFPLLHVLQAVQFEDDLRLTDAQTEIMARWRETKQPDYLTQLGIDYLTFTKEWFNLLTEEERSQIEESYIWVSSWATPLNTSETLYFLYKVP